MISKFKILVLVGLASLSMIANSQSAPWAANAQDKTLSGLAPAVAAEKCQNEYQVIFAAMPKGSPYWISPANEFTTGLPANLRGKAGSAAIELSMRRLTDRLLLAEFRLFTEVEVTAALYSIDMPAGGRGFTEKKVDENGNAWSISIAPACPVVL